MCSPCVLLPFRYWSHWTVTRNAPNTIYFRMLIEISYLIGELRWSDYLVTGERLDELTAGDLVGVISPVRDTFVLLEAVEDESLILECTDDGFYRDGRAVIDNNTFPIGEGLSANTLKRVLQQLGLIQNGDAD